MQILPGNYISGEREREKVLGKIKVFNSKSQTVLVKLNVLNFP